MSGRIRTIVLATAAISTTLAMTPIYTVLRWTNSPKKRSYEVRWHRAMCWILGVRVEKRGLVAQPDGHGVLIASNHVSYLDILVLGSLAPISFVAKEEVRDWAIFGTFARWQDSVFVNRNVRVNAKEQVKQINERLAAGHNIVLFPEGTTSDGNFLFPFKSSLFGALGIGSTSLASPIQPVSIAYVSQHGLPMGRYDRPLAAWPGDIEMMPHLLRVLREGHLGVVVTFGEPIAIEGHINRKQIAKAVQESVARMTASALLGRVALPTRTETN